MSAPTPERIAEIRKWHVAAAHPEGYCGTCAVIAALDAEKQRADAADKYAAQAGRAMTWWAVKCETAITRAEAAEKALQDMSDAVNSIDEDSYMDRLIRTDTVAQNVLAASTAATGRDDAQQ